MDKTLEYLQEHLARLRQIHFFLIHQDANMKNVCGNLETTWVMNNIGQWQLCKLHSEHIFKKNLLHVQLQCHEKCQQT